VASSEDTAGATSASSSQKRSPQPGFFTRHQRASLSVLGAVLLAGFVYYVVPQIAGLGPTLERLRGGDLWWLALGVLFEAISITGEITLFRGVFSRPGARMPWRVSYQITLAGGAATKILATAGAGGIALTVWALRARGLPAAAVARGLVCYEILTYGVYMAALAIFGFGLWFGVFPGRAPIGLTLAPALFGTAVILIVLSMLFADKPTEQFLLKRADAAHGRLQRWLRRAAALPHSLQSGLEAAIAMFRRRDPSVLGAVVGWGFDIGTLWASFRAFGPAPPAAVLVMGYYVGTLANTLPLPGGIGGVEGGMIGSFLAFGVNGSLAVLAVLAYRTISYWLPTAPGVVAYVQLRRRHGPPQGQAADGARVARRAATGTSVPAASRSGSP
jgi:uncharacterized protein (TIRG00374 family)